MCAAVLPLPVVPSPNCQLKRVGLPVDELPSKATDCPAVGAAGAKVKVAAREPPLPFEPMVTLQVPSAPAQPVLVTLKL